MNNTNITSNRALYKGGGVYLNELKNNLVIQNSLFYNNSVFYDENISIYEKM